MARYKYVTLGTRTSLQVEFDPSSFNRSYQVKFRSLVMLQIYCIIQIHRIICIYSKIVSEYDQEIPQSQTADNPLAPRGRAAQPSRDTRKTN